MEGRQRNRISNEQREELIDAISANYILATGRFVDCDGKSKKEDFWRNLTESLNLLGNLKSKTEWQKVCLST